MLLMNCGFFDRVENIAEKVPAFSTFSTRFLKDLYLRVVNDYDDNDDGNDDYYDAATAVADDDNNNQQFALFSTVFSIVSKTSTHHKSNNRILFSTLYNQIWKTSYFALVLKSGRFENTMGIGKTKFHFKSNISFFSHRETLEKLCIEITFCYTIALTLLRPSLFVRLPSPVFNK